MGNHHSKDRMTYNHLLVEQAGAVRRVWLNREGMRNAQSQALLDELDAAMKSAREDVDTRVLVLAAKGKHFSAGHDLKEAQEKRADFSVEERWAYEEKRYFEYCMTLWDFPKPTVAQVQGACIAAGFMLANMCDLLVASEDAFFSDPVTHTLGAAATEVLIHPWVMSLRAAKEFLFLGERVDAQRAWQLGFVNKVVPNAELDDAAMQVAQRIAQAPPFAMRITKRSLNRSMDTQGLRQALSAHFDLHQLSHVSDEYQRSRDAGLSNAIQKGARHGASS